MMHHPVWSLILEKVDQVGKINLLTTILKTTLMKKKILFFAMMGISVMAFARTLQAVWTSTCGVTHYTTFPSGYTYSQMANWIEAANLVECGTEVHVTINP
ncbi:hypothetical protein [Chryseobacterium wanjuense]